MPDVKSSYELRRFTTSTDADLEAALRLYVKNTPSNIRTDKAEIIYWLERFSKEFQDEFYVFGFFHNRKLIGYAEAAYFRLEHIFALDYLVVDEPFRRAGAFNEFVDSLRIYLEDAHPDYKYGFAEVAQSTDNGGPSSENPLVRLLTMQGFRAINAPYYQPRLTHDDIESEIRAHLLIYTTSPLQRIHAETYLKVVHTIYYKYYLRWNTMEPATIDEYQKHLDWLFTTIKSKIGKRKTIAIENDHPSRQLSPAHKPMFPVNKLVWFVAQAALVIAVLTAILLGLRSAFNISEVFLFTAFILAVLTFFAVAGIKDKNARSLFGELVALVKYYLDRQTGGPRQIDSKKKDALPPPRDEE